MWTAHPFGRRGSAKKRFGGALALFLALTLVLTGCGANHKEAI